MRTRKRRFYRQRLKERKNWHRREIVSCWCGATGTCEELFADDCSEGCGGSGQLDCYCGGDFCVCHNHGSVDCPGCDDCQAERDDYDPDDFEEYLDEALAASDYE